MYTFQIGKPCTGGAHFKSVSHIHGLTTQPKIGKPCIASVHVLSEKCTLDCAVKPCIGSVHVQFEMNAIDTFLQ